MKYIYIIALLFSTSALFAQNDDEFKTIFGGSTIGGYGAIGGGYSPINSDNAMVFNARGGVVLGHTLAMGIGGTGFLTEYQYSGVYDKNASLVGGYGGVFIELIILGRSPVHVSVPVLIGLGGAAYTTWDNEGQDYERENSVQESTTFGVFEPGIELEFNIASFFRLAAFCTYRYTSSISLTSIVDGQTEPIELVEPDALTTYSAGLIFKFGKF